MYTFKSRVRYSECEESGHLSLFHMINYLQDCSVFHSEAVGQGIADLQQEGLVWVLSSWKLEIERYPSLGEWIETGTFSVGFRGFFGFRNFFIRDEAGKDLVRVYSIWTLLNQETGHPVRVTPQIGEVYGREPELPMKDKSRKIPAPSEDAVIKQQDPVTVCRYHLDTNHHMNNGRYVEIAKACLPPDFVAGSVHISYKKAAVLQDVLYPVCYEMEDRYQVALRDGAGEDYCVCEFCARESGSGFAELPE